jgi:hypothetical protein
MFITVCQQLQVSPNYLLAADLGTAGFVERDPFDNRYYQN